MQDILANLLMTQDALTALVTNRVHWDALPQGFDHPGVAMWIAGAVKSYTLAGRVNLAMTRVQIDSLGRTAAEARSVAEAISALLSGFNGTFEGVRFQGVFESGQRTGHNKADGKEWFTDSRDYEIHWAPA